MFVMATLYLSCLSSRAKCIIKTENHTRGATYERNGNEHIKDGLSKRYSDWDCDCDGDGNGDWATTWTCTWPCGVERSAPLRFVGPGALNLNVPNCVLWGQKYAAFLGAAEVCVEPAVCAFPWVFRLVFCWTCRKRQTITTTKHLAIQSYGHTECHKELPKKKKLRGRRPTKFKRDLRLKSMCVCGYQLHWHEASAGGFS